MSRSSDKLHLDLPEGYFSTAHAGFTAYSKFLRDNFDPRHANFIVSSLSSANTLDLSGSDSEVEFIEAIGKKSNSLYTNLMVILCELSFTHALSVTKNLKY
jgi:hypothetical protein